MSDKLENQVDRFKTLLDKLETIMSESGDTSGETKMSFRELANKRTISIDHTKALDQILNDSCNVKTSKEQPMIKLFSMLQRIYSGLLSLFQCSMLCKKPSNDDLQKVIKGIGEDIINTIKKSLFPREFMNWENVVKDHINLLFVQCIDTDLQTFIGNQTDSIYFMLNKIQKEDKTKNPNETEGVFLHRHLVKSVRETLKAQTEFIKDNCDFGFQWGKFGKNDFHEVQTSLMKCEYPNEENKTTEVVEVKKPVEKISSAPKKFEKKPSQRLFAQNHFYENYKNENEIQKIENVKMMEGVYFACCEKMTQQVVPKCKSVTIEACKQLKIGINNLITSAEVVNSKNIEIFTTGYIPNFQLDKCEGIKIHLSHKCAQTKITTSKCSECRILRFLNEGDEEEITYDIPPQFTTSWNGNEYVTEIVKHE